MAKIDAPQMLRDALAKRGMKQTALERALNVSVGTASRWLSGKKCPDVSHAVRIEAMLGIPVSVWADAREAAARKRARAKRAALAPVAEPAQGAT